MVDVKATGDLKDAAFDALVREFGAERALVAMTVMFCESGLRAWQRNGSGAPYYGVNQMGRRELDSLGLTPLQWLSMPAEQQIPYVAHFWGAKVAHFGGWIWQAPENLYGCNFLPARCFPGMPRDRALTKKGDHDYQDAVTRAWHSFYESNTALDVNGDGQIDLDDFAAWIEKRKGQEPARWRELAARLEDALARGAQNTKPPTADDVVAAGGVPIYLTPDPSSDEGGSTPSPA